MENSVVTKTKKGQGIIDLSKPWEYKPWIHAREVSNGSGRRHVLNDLKYPNRKVYLMSDLEKKVYYYLRRNNNVIELFEQFPLNIQKTTNLCEELNIVHPRNPKNGKRIVMTTDFLALIDNNSKSEYQAFPGEIRKDVYGQPHISEARLNIEDFYKIVLQFILYHNKTPIGKYQCDKSIFDAGIIPTPLNIWNFKMKETNNLRRIPNIEQYRFSLLSDANATITREGIIFNKMIYTCEDLEWLSREMAEASFGPRKKIAIKYDKRNLNIIHIERNGYYITGWLNERKTINEKYFDSIIEQVESINKQLSQRERLSHELGVVQRINLNAKTDEIVKDAKRRHSGKNSKKNIRENRRIEKELLHKEAQIVPEKTCNAKLTHCEQQHCVQERAPSLVYTEHPDFHKLSTAEKIRIMEEIEFEKAVFGYSGEMEES